jgi:hypothetical protein
MHKYNKSPIREVTPEIREHIDRMVANSLKARVYRTIKDYESDLPVYLCTYEVDRHIHTGYPIVDPDRGRPHLSWKRCQFPGCTDMCYSFHQKWGKGDEKTLKQEAVLSTKIRQGTIEDHPRLLDTRVEDHLATNGLVRHLKQHKKFVQGLHLMHEKIVEQTELTPEKIIEYQLTRCPSVTCTENEREFTPEQLIEHFKVLGIPPFWKPGEVSVNEMNLYSLESNQRAPFAFAEDMVCSYCSENRSDFVCGHCRVTKGCWKCFGEHQNYGYHRLKCSTCNVFVSYMNPGLPIKFIPF